MYTLYVFMQELCKKKGLNHLLQSKTELYDEYFVVPKEKTSKEVTETKQEKQDRLKRGRTNKKSFHKYLSDNVADRLDRALMLTADVPDERAFNPHKYRPMIDRLQTITTLISLGVEETDACNMAECISTFPTSRQEVRKKICVLSCSECNQHELMDGTRINGFMPKGTTVSLTTAPWSNWKQAMARYGKRRGQDACYLRNMCERCDVKRQLIHQKSNEKKKLTRARMLKGLGENSLHILDGNGDSEESKQLFAHCAVHATHVEKKMWPKFAQLKQVRCVMLFDIAYMCTLYVFPRLRSYKDCTTHAKQGTTGPVQCVRLPPNSI